MSVVKFLIELKELHVFITKNDQNLSVKGDKKALTPILKNKLAESKDEILSFYNKLAITSNNQIAPTTFSQQRLWFIDQLEGSSNHYNMPTSLRLFGKLNLDAMQKHLIPLLTDTVV